MNRMNRKRHLDSVVEEDELEELDDELEDDEDDDDWEDMLEEEKEIKVKFGFLNAVKFGIGFGAGIFIWGVILAIIGFTLFGGMAGIMNMISNTF